MQSINHFVLRNGKLIPKAEADSQRPPTLSTVSRVTTISSFQEAHKKEIESLKNEFNLKIR